MSHPGAHKPMLLLLLLLTSLLLQMERGSDGPGGGREGGEGERVVEGEIEGKGGEKEGRERQGRQRVSLVPHEPLLILLYIIMPCDGTCATYMPHTIYYLRVITSHMCHLC